MNATNRNGPVTISRGLDLQRLVCELSNDFINLPAEQIDAYIVRALGRIAQFLEFEVAAVAKLSGRGHEGKVTHIWKAPGVPPLPPSFTDRDFPWVAERIARGEAVHLPALDALPAAARTDRETYERIAAQSVYNWPLNVGRHFIGCLGFVSLGQPRAFPAEFIEEIRLFTQIIANALNRERASAAISQSLAFERQLLDLSSHLLKSSPPHLDAEIIRGLCSLAEFFGVDRCTLWRWSADGSQFDRAYSDPEGQAEGAVASLSMDEFPWLVKELTAGRVVRVECLSDYPIEARKERQFSEAQGLKSVLAIPLLVGERLVGCCSFLAVQSERNWPPALVQRLRLAGELFAHVLERQRAWEQLRETSERFRVVADSAPVMIWMSGADKVCNFFNAGWLNFTGRTLAQELGNGWTEGVHPDDRAGCLKQYSESFDAQRPFHLEYRLRRHDGEYRWVSDVGVPRYDSGQNFLGYIGSCVDLTERKQAEEKFRLVVEASPGGVVLVNAEGRIVLVNTTTEKLFGYARGELIGQNVEMLVPERFRGVHPSHRTGFYAAPQARAMGAGRELFARRKDGTEFPVEIGLSPIRSGEELLVLMSIVDITTRKRADAEAMVQRAELTHIARVSTMGALASSLAHELNQPLSAILSNAQAASRFLAAAPPDLAEVREALEDIAQDTRRAGEVIRQVRALVRRDEPNLLPLDLNRVVADVARLLHSDMLIRKVQVALELDPALGMASGDSAQLQQVIINLVLNAFDSVKVVPENRRTVVLRTRQPDAGTVRVEVSDQGTGISPTRLAHLFEPFRSTKREGLGLGLNISHSIIEAHQGQLWAENNPDHGATFYFSLPVYTAELPLP